MFVGSGFKHFEKMIIKDKTVNVDLVEIRNSRKKIWRKFEIKIKNWEIVGFKSTNPVTNETAAVK